MADRIREGKPCDHSQPRCASCGWGIGDEAITRQPYAELKPERVRVRIMAGAGGGPVWIVRDLARVYSNAGWCVSVHELEAVPNVPTVGVEEL